jgi:signal transduction histidine kinase
MLTLMDRIFRRWVRLAAVGVALGSCWPEISFANAVVVTNLAQLQESVLRQQRITSQISLEGVVCWVSEAKDLAVLQDATGAARVELDPRDSTVRPGDILVLEGSGTARGGGSGFTLGKTLVVNNDLPHAWQERTGEIFLRPGHHPIRVAWFNRESTNTLGITYQPPGEARQPIPANALSHRNFAPLAELPFSPGMVWHSYEGAWWQMPDFAQIASRKEGLAPGFDLAMRGRDSFVALRFDGWLEVPREGVYSFYTASSGGSQLFLGLPEPRLLGRTNVPAPRQLALGQLLPSAEGCWWSVAEGTVEFVSENEGAGYSLIIGSGTGRLRVELNGKTDLARELLIDCRVRLTGLAWSASTLDEHRIPGLLWVPEASHMEILSLSPRAWDSKPVSSIGEWVTEQAAPEALGHLQGQILALGPGPVMTVSDGTGQIELHTRQPLPKAPGGQVDALVVRSARTGQTNWACIAFREVDVHDAPLPILTTVEEIKRLSRDQAMRGYPVQIRGVVTWSDRTAVVLQDFTSGIFIDEVELEDDYHQRWGEYWEVEGTTVAQFAPMVRARRVTRLGRGIVPEPIRPAWDQLLNGSLDAQYVELQGVATAVETNRITLLTRDGKLQAWLPESSPDQLRKHEGALIRIRGCLWAVKDEITHVFKIGEVQIHSAFISVDEPPPADPFSAPRKRAAELRLFDAQAAILKPVKVVGQVVHHRAGVHFLVDGTNGLRFALRAPVTLAAGDLVEVVGFPKLGGPSPLLGEALARKTGRAPLPEPIPLPEGNLSEAELDSRLVQAEGLLLNLGKDQEDQVFGLQTGSHVFVARLPTRTTGGITFPVGSQLCVQGTFVRLGSDSALNGEMNSFELLLDSPSDVRLLARPAWSTLRQMMIVVGVLGGGLLVLLGWVTMLRRQVDQRSAQLRVEIQERERAEKLQAIEAERSRIARDLHDDLGSSLTEISLLADAGGGRPANLEKAATRFRSIGDKARALVRALDVIVWLVNPTKDSLPFLAGYLGSYAEEYLSASGVTCRLKIPLDFPPIRLNTEVRHNLFLAIKEVLHNTVRHAHAREVLLEFAWHEGTLEITVADNGQGFDKSSPVDGNGLANLRARVGSSGGTCDLVSCPGSGTTVRIKLPLTINPEPSPSLRT